MPTKLYSLTVKGHTKRFSFDVYVDPKYVDEWRAEGLDIDEIVNTVPLWVAGYGPTAVRAWRFIQDVFNFKNPFQP